MYVKIRLKHLVIPIIVFGISFISLLYSNIAIIKNPILDVDFVYTSGDLVEHSIQRLLWDSLLNTTTLPEDSSYANINFESQKVSPKNVDKINEIAKRSEVVFLVNFPVDENLNEVFLKNPRKTFVLVGNNYDSKRENVININVDKNYIITNAAKDLVSKTTTHKYLFVDTPTSSDEDFALFSQQIIKNDPQAMVEVYVVNDPTNSILIRQEILNYFTQGYESIFVNDIVLNDLLVNICSNYENDIYNYNLKQTEIAETSPEVPSNISPYLFNNVNLITIGYDNIADGTYIDTNLDGIIDYHDDGVVLESYEYIFSNITNEIIQKIAENKKFEPTYTLETSNNSLVEKKNDGKDQEGEI